MQATAKITPFQFYSVLFLSRVFSLVTYVSSVRGTLSTSAEVVAVIIMTVILFITTIPTAILVKKDSQSSILTRAACISPLMQKVVCIIYMAGLIYKGIITAARFELLLGSVMFPETNVLFFVAILLLSAAFFACRGIEAIGRSAVIFLVPVFFALGFVFLTLTDDFDMLNFSAICTDETMNIIDAAVYSASRTGETAAAVLLLPFVKNHKPKHLYIWLGTVSAVIIITETMISGVLGGFGENQLFNMYSLSVLAKFGFIERMDAIISCIWMICAAVKLAVVFYLCKTVLGSLSGKNRTITYISISAAVIFIGMMLISLSIVNFADVIRSPLTIIFYFLIVVFVPLTVIIAEKIKEKRNEKA